MSGGGGLCVEGCSCVCMFVLLVLCEYVLLVCVCVCGCLCVSPVRCARGANLEPYRDIVTG